MFNVKCVTSYSGQTLGVCVLHDYSVATMYCHSHAVVFSCTRYEYYECGTPAPGTGHSPLFDSYISEQGGLS